jgi:hypothetical protein
MITDQERELRQLFFVASNGLRKARSQIRNANSARQAILQKNMKFFADLFTGKTLTLNADHEWCVLLSAELSSAAVRLVTIEERLRSAGHLTRYGAFQDLVSEVKHEKLLRDAFEKQLDQILHVLLRDNVAHIEPSAGGGKPYWRARQRVLESQTLGGIAQTLTTILRVIDKCLKTRGVIS